MHYLDLPDVIADPGEFADCYARDDAAGVWRLTDAARAYIARCRSEIDALHAQHKRALDAKQAEHNRLRDGLHNHVMRRDLDQALIAAGANDVTVHGARAFFLQTQTCEVEERRGQLVTVVAVGDQRVPVSRAVEHWLLSDAGAPFAKRRQVRGVDSDLIARINRLRD